MIPDTSREANDAESATRTRPRARWNGSLLDR